MGIILWIAFGFVAGWIAKFLFPGKAPGGVIATILIGIVGAVVGGFVGMQLGFGGFSEFDLRGIAIAVGGAVLVLFVYGLLSKRK